MHFRQENHATTPPAIPASATLSSNMTTNERLLDAVAKVQKAAQADRTGMGQPHVDLLAAVKQLNLAAESPAERLMRLRHEPLQHAAVRIAIEARWLEEIVARKGRPISAAEIAKATGHDALFTARIMRLVTNWQICDEVAEDVYVATPTTDLLVVPGQIGGTNHFFDLFYPIGSKIVELMRSKQIHQWANPEAGEKTPFELTFGMPFWQYLENSTEQRRYFDDFMQVRRAGLLSWYETFPMASELCPDAKKDADSVLLVDVGGNKGHEAAAFHAAHPDHPGKIILQDLPFMLEKIERGQIEHPEGVELMNYDFFTEQPVKGARAYYFRNICHDWDDEHSEALLTNTAKAMEKGYSRILIDDYVLPPTGAPQRASTMDMLMMVFCSGIERTRRQWEVLLDKCGLEIVKIWGGRSDYEQVIEAQLKE